MDIRQSDLWARYLEKLGWQTEKISPGYFAFVKKIPLLGSTIKIPQASLPIPFKEIDSLAQKAKAGFVKLEPLIETTDSSAHKVSALLKNAHFTADNWALNPTKTIVIDLTKSEGELLAVMEKDTRYSVRLAMKSGVGVKETNDLGEFKKIYLEVAARKKFWPAKKELDTLWEVFSKENAATILTAFFENKPIAACLLLFNNKVGIYYHAASLPVHREVMAPYLVLWEAMRFLKNKGIASFDLAGIADPRIKNTKKWKGFTLFKRGFGGREVEYLGSFVKYYKLWSKVLFFPARFL